MWRHWCFTSPISVPFGIGSFWVPQIDYFNNQIIVDLVEQQHKGIISILDDACMNVGKVTDEMFLEALNSKLGKHGHFSSRKVIHSMQTSSPSDLKGFHHCMTELNALYVGLQDVHSTKKGHKHSLNDLLLWLNSASLVYRVTRLIKIIISRRGSSRASRNRKNEHDSLESMMSFVTNRYRVLVPVPECCSCT